nr:hypothetical protein [Effusibacillus dendaii]
MGRIIQYGPAQRAVRGVTFQPIQAEDIIPVPCHPDGLAMGYALKTGGRVTPLTGLIDPQIRLEGGRNTIVFEQDETLKEKIFDLFSTSHSPDSSAISPEKSAVLPADGTSA